jgi:hypothetical protein
MSVRTLLVAAIFAFITFDNATIAQEPNRPEVSVQKLRNVAAQDVAQAIATFAKQKKLAVTVVAEPVSNTVMVAGDADGVKQSNELIAALDKQPAVIVAQLLIVEVPLGFATDLGLAEGTENTWSLTARETRMVNAAFRNKKEIKILFRPQMTAADNQTGYLKVGGDLTNNYSVRITSRVMPEGGVLARIETSVKGSSGSEVETQTTTAKTHDGGTVVTRMTNVPAKEGEATEVLLIMTVHVVRN